MDLDLDLSGKRRDDPTPGYALRLRPTVRLCAILAVLVALIAVLSWFLVREADGRPWPGLPPSVPLFLVMLAAVLILLSTRFRASILRRAFPRSAALPIQPDAVIAAYQKATLASFLILEVSALCGLLVALTSGAAAYGIIVCAVVLFGMINRWPRATVVDRLIRGRATP